VLEQRIEDGLSVLGGNRLRITVDSDGPGHVGEAFLI